MSDPRARATALDRSIPPGFLKPAAPARRCHEATRMPIAASTSRLYSQHGEDALILAAFEDVPRGVFVEVGCIDGRRFSNTLALEERGWRGVCVEAHADYIDLIRANRPASLVVHAAAGDRDANDVPFYANARGSLSTLDPSLEERWRRDYAPWFSGFTEQRVPMRTISTILDDANVDLVHVLSIDVEGCDALALSGLDLARHRPDLVVIEADDPEAREQIDAMLLPAGYLPGPIVGGNGFYFRDAQRLARVRGRRFEGFLMHTRHPLDQGEDERVAFRFDM